jgi:hypothetical protein
MAASIMPEQQLHTTMELIPGIEKEAQAKLYYCDVARKQIQPLVTEYACVAEREAALAVEREGLDKESKELLSRLSVLLAAASGSQRPATVAIPSAPTELSAAQGMCSSRFPAKLAINAYKERGLVTARDMIVLALADGDITGCAGLARAVKDLFDHPLSDSQVHSAISVLTKMNIMTSVQVPSDLRYRTYMLTPEGRRLAEEARAMNTARENVEAPTETATSAV